VSAPAYEADAGDRIIATLAQEKVALRERLAAAARLAGQQLELLMPIVLAPTAAGVVAGTFTMAAPGTVLFVLADDHRVATVHVLDQPDMVDRIIEGAREIRQFIQANGGKPVHGAVATVVHLYLHEYGGDLGAATPSAPARAATNTIAALFAGLTDEEVRHSLGTAREIAAHGSCPAFVALLGPGAKPGTLAGCWPLLLHLAPFIDAALLGNAEEGGRA
jgi:hypothetical protein